MEMVERVARIICARSMGGFCKYVGGELGCKVGRGTGDYTQCVADGNQLVLSGAISIAEEIALAIRATPVSEREEG